MRSGMLLNGECITIDQLQNFNQYENIESLMWVIFIYFWMQVFLSQKWYKQLVMSLNPEAIKVY